MVHVTSRKSNSLALGRPMSHRSTRCCSRSRRSRHRALETALSSFRARCRIAHGTTLLLLAPTRRLGDPNTAVELKLIRFQNGAQIDVDHHEILQMEDDIITKIYFK